MLTKSIYLRLDTGPCQGQDHRKKKYYQFLPRLGIFVLVDLELRLHSRCLFDLVEVMGSWWRTYRKKPRRPLKEGVLAAADSGEDSEINIDEDTDDEEVVIAFKLSVVVTVSAETVTGQNRQLSWWFNEPFLPNRYCPSNIFLQLDAHSPRTNFCISMNVFSY
jgi:hypothetical protein